MKWREFDYFKPVDGIFWAVVKSLEYDVDIDDCGTLVGGPIGEQEPVVRLIEVDYDGDGTFYIYTDIIGQQNLEMEDGILLIADVEKPKMPELTQAEVRLEASN